MQDIKIFNDRIKNKIEDYEKYLKDYEKDKKINERNPIIIK